MFYPNPLAKTSFIHLSQRYWKYYLSTVTKKEIIASLQENRGVENIKRIAKHLLEGKQQQDCLDTLELAAPLPYRISWVIDHMVRMEPSCFEPFLQELLTKKDRMDFPGYERNLSFILSQSTIPENIESEILELAFFWIADPRTKVAVKAHALYTCENLCNKYPELKDEFREILLNEIPRNSVGFTSRAKRILKRL